MKTFKKSAVIFLLFLLGTLSVIHVDRQCQAAAANGMSIIGNMEKFIENYR
ncbi:MAG: hypothetical protein ACI4LA_06015 [Emergencia sp.]